MEDTYRVAYNLGCGRAPWPDWINVDLEDERADIRCDVRSLTHIESNSADAVAAIHILEHLYLWDVPEALAEWRRILKPGGKLILELPCMDKVFTYVAASMMKRQPMLPPLMLYAMYGDPNHRNPAMCHKWGWFIAELKKVLEAAKFREVTLCDPRYHFKVRDMRFEAIK